MPARRWNTSTRSSHRRKLDGRSSAQCRRQWIAWPTSRWLALVSDSLTDQEVRRDLDGRVITDINIATDLPDTERDRTPSEEDMGENPPSVKDRAERPLRPPPLSSALAKPRLCRPGAPPLRSSLTDSPLSLWAFAPLPPKNAVAFRGRGIMGIQRSAKQGTGLDGPFPVTVS